MNRSGSAAAAVETTDGGVDGEERTLETSVGVGIATSTTRTEPSGAREKDA